MVFHSLLQVYQSAFVGISNIETNVKLGLGSNLVDSPLNLSDTCGGFHKSWGYPNS